MTVYEQALNHANKCRRLIEEAKRLGEPIPVRKCSVCGEVKPLYAYYTHPTARGGYYTFCKECQQKKIKAYKMRKKLQQRKEQE